MKTNCSKCKGEIDTGWKVCPFCGTKVLDTLNKQFALIEKMRNLFGSELDNSPEGLRKTQDYLEKVSEYIENYQTAQKKFIEKFEALRQSSKLIKDKKWSIQITNLLGAMTIFARGVEFSDTNKRYLPYPPNGCTGIAFNYNDFTERHEELIDNYSIIQRQNITKIQDVYQLFSTPIAKISEAIVAVIEELEKVTKKFEESSTNIFRSVKDLSIDGIPFLERLEIHRKYWDSKGSDKGPTPEETHIYDQDFSYVDFSNMDLSYLILNGVDFSHAIMKGANLFGIEIHESNFKYAYLEDTSFRMGFLDSCDFQYANMEKTDFEFIDIDVSLFNKANLKEANLVHADIKKTKFISAEFTKANFTDSNLMNVDLRNAIMREAIFKNTNLSGSDLTGTDLRGATIKGINNARLKDSIC